MSKKKWMLFGGACGRKKRRSRMKEIMHKGNEFILDAVQDCQKQFCTLFERCGFQKDGPCEFERRYMEAIIKPYKELLMNIDDPFLTQQIGARLIPKYKMLLRFKKIEMSLMDGDVIYTNRKGDMRTNPVYEALLNVDASIQKDFDMYLTRILMSKGYMGGKNGDSYGNLSDNACDGIPGMYEIMTGGDRGES